MRKNVSHGKTTIKIFRFIFRSWGLSFRFGKSWPQIVLVLGSLVNTAITMGINEIFFKGLLSDRAMIGSSMFLMLPVAVIGVRTFLKYTRENILYNLMLTVGSLNLSDEEIDKILKNVRNMESDKK